MCCSSQRHDVPLLVIEVLLQRCERPVEGIDEAVARVGSGIDPPDPECGIHRVQVGVELFVLIVHRSREGGRVRTAVHQ